MEAAIERSAELRAGELEVRPQEFLATVAGSPLNLTSRELELLTALVERSGRIVSREELYSAVWGEPYRDPTARSTSTWASCARSSTRRCPAGASSTRISDSATASQPQPVERPITRIS